MTSNDDAQITELFDRMLRAWTDGDAEAYGACVTQDCDYVPFDGSRSIGREAVVDSHDKLFRGVLAGSALVAVREADGVDLRRLFARAARALGRGRPVPSAI